MDVQTKELVIPTANGHTLAVSKFFSKHSIGETIVVSSATGVLQKYYAKFAKFFASKGFTVYTFDYYGIGKSNGTENALRKNTANLTSWGENDQAAVIAFAQEENSGTKLTLVTHSIGGQIVGFNPNHRLLDRIILVASQSGYWKHFNGLHRVKMWLFWYAMIPCLTPLFGYFPAKKLGLFENLPKNVVYEWATWGKQPKYLMHFYNGETYQFNKLKIPILSLSFSRDSYAPIKTVDWLAGQFKHARVQRVHHQPKNGERHVKHFGFFKAWAEKPYWEKCLQYIQHGAYKS